MKITGTFRTKDNNRIRVTFYNKRSTLPSINIDTSDDIFFGDEPVIITTEADDTFEHILRTQAKVTLVTRNWLGDYLFADNAKSIVVNIWKDDVCIFAGYVSPASYNQNFSHELEPIEINCVDTLTTLQNRRLTDDNTYEELVAQSSVRPFSWFFDKINLEDPAGVIPNLPDFPVEEMHIWVETSWTRMINNETNEISYYAIESECVVLDEETAVATGDTRIGSYKTPTYIQSEDTCIVDGIQYYKKYAWITINGEDVNTGDWIVGDPTNEMPYVVSTRNEIDGWTNGVLPQPFDFYEHYTTYNTYSNGMEIAVSDGIGDNIPEYPNTTTNGSYYEFREGASDDLDVDETTGISYYKDYAWVCVNNVCENSGQWKRGDLANQFRNCDIYGSMVNGSQYPPTMTLNNNVVIADQYDPDTQEFGFSNVPTLTYFSIDAEGSNIETMYFGDIFGNNAINMYQKFNVCYNLKVLDIHNIKKFSNWASAFENCGSLTNIITRSGIPFITSSLSDSYRMFKGCSNLQGTLDCRYIASDNTALMFFGCTNISKVMLSNKIEYQNDSAVQWSIEMFENSGITEVEYHQLIEYNWPNFRTFKLITDENTLTGVNHSVSFTMIDSKPYKYSVQYTNSPSMKFVSNFDFVSGTNITITCTTNQNQTIMLTPEHIDGHYFYKVPNEYLNDISSISFDGYGVEIYTPKFIISNNGVAPSMSFNVENLDLTFCSPETISTYDSMFENNTRIYSVNLGSADLSGLTHYNMFNGCANLSEIYIDNENTLYELTDTLSRADGDYVPSTCTIYYRGYTYVYDSNTNTWITQ